MKPEAIEQVLMEVLEELKTLKGQKEKESRTLEDLCQTVKSFDEKLSTMKVTALPTDLSYPIGELPLKISKKNIKVIVSSYGEAVHVLC